MRISKFSGYNSIRSKLFLGVILSGSFALSLIGLLLFGYGSIESRNSAKRELLTQARIVADSSAAALVFDDEKSATQTLSALRSDPDILQAASYNRGHLFAWYQRDTSGPAGLPASPGREGAYFDSGNLLLTQPVRLSGQVIGTIFLKASMKDADAHLRRYMGIVSLVLLFSLGPALAVSARMLRTITLPLASLSSVARAVSLDKDYSARATKLADDEVGFLVDSFNQMLARVEVREQALRESEERYALAARGANDGLWDWKLTTNEIYFSPRWNQMLGYPEAESWSNPEEWFEKIHTSDCGRVKADIAAHCAGQTAELATEYRIRQKSGAYLWALSRGIVVRDASGVAIRMAGSQSDITQGKVADPITGLPNRLYFLDRLGSVLDADLRTGAGFAVLFLDMDRFKLVNDSMGHAAGDALLMGVADRLRASLAASCLGCCDALSLVARLGGDEFAILLNPVTGDSQAAMIAERILADMDQPFQIHGRQVFAGLSIGVAMNSSGHNPEDLLRNADTAMYHAKAEGKGRFAIFDDGMRCQAVARLEIETALRNAIDKGEMVLYYQPQISIDDRCLTGFEALVRWKHPKRGMVPPLDFIPVAEETGLIVPLGTWVLREACRRMSEWHADFAFAPLLTIAVNVSFKQLTGIGFVDDVRTILMETGLPPQCLRLEMTESAVMKNPQETVETLHSLKEIGVGLEIDDFGTGYSSLGYLSTLPFDTLKIDRMFVSDLGTRPESGEIVKTILDLARSLKLDVVAEGVENEIQLQKLRDLGCARAQGYYFSKPVAREAVPGVFEREAARRAFSWLAMGDSTCRMMLPIQSESRELSHSLVLREPDTLPFDRREESEREIAVLTK